MMDNLVLVNNISDSDLMTFVNQLANLFRDVTILKNLMIVQGHKRIEIKTKDSTDSNGCWLELSHFDTIFEVIWTDAGRKVVRMWLRSMPEGSIYSTKKSNSFTGVYYTYSIGNCLTGRTARQLVEIWLAHHPGYRRDILNVIINHSIYAEPIPWTNEY